MHAILHEKQFGISLLQISVYIFIDETTRNGSVSIYAHITRS